jgi:hypothetical protein
MNFKVGDEVVLLPNWGEEQRAPGDPHGEGSKVLIIKRIIPNFTRTLLQSVTRIDFENFSGWAEPHEIRFATPLEKMIK